MIETSVGFLIEVHANDYGAVSDVYQTWHTGRFKLSNVH